MRILAVSIFVLSGLLSAGAQETTAPTTDAADATPPVDAAAPVEATAKAAPNPDEMADFLNSQQQIRQGVTLTRTVDGKVIETRSETITYSPDDPLRGSEAGPSPLDALQAEFDSAALTRKEAFEEAKLDFVVADLNRDGKLDESEFVFLVNGWQDATVRGSGRGRFVDPTPHADEAAAKADHERQARAKFAFISGGAPTVSKKDYIREVLIDFDALDKSDDGILTGGELLHFRIANRGESIVDQPAPAVSEE